jgi:hypothetical protein
MSITKQITPTGKMSNLVGMYCLVLYEEKCAVKIKRTGFVYGKADECYIIQWHNSLSGEALNCQLFYLIEMKNWMFLPNRETQDYIMEDYSRHGYLRCSLLKEESIK